uniref:Uncharacterized protein n=1 Tax=Arundo donax TaxID=35708 RepID=A0A0A8YDL4_ARUDO
MTKEKYSTMKQNFNKKKIYPTDG